MTNPLLKLWHLCVPPLDQRHGTALAPLGILGSSATILLSVYIRIKYPNLAFHWRMLFLMLCTFFVIQNNLSRYTRFPWQKKGEDDTLGYYVMIDVITGGGIFGVLSMVIDYLFLAREDELDVNGADEYRKYLVDKYPNLSVEQLKTLEKELCDGGTFERPLYYPGTKNYYIRDLADATRGLGYKKGLNQKGIAAYEGGYSALIGAEKLENSDPQIAQAVKQVTVFRTLKTFVTCFLCYDFLEWVISNKKVLDPNTNDSLSGLQAALHQTSLPQPFAKYFVVCLFGCAIVARLQAFSAFIYLIALVFTKPTHIPITIGRWEPLLFYKPHLSTSMGDMWGTHWHGLIRRPVTVLFMRPCKTLVKKLGLPLNIGRAVGVLLSFAYSGLMHEVIMEAILPHIRHLKRFTQYDEATLRQMGYGWGSNRFASTRFFINCGLVVVLEDIFCSFIEPKLAVILFGKGREQIISGKARSVLGWLWCMSCMVVIAVDLVETWCRHEYNNDSPSTASILAMERSTIIGAQATHNLFAVSLTLNLMPSNGCGLHSTLSPFLITSVACLLHYTHWNAPDKPSIIWGNGDAYMGACALSILIYTLDFLFLARDDEQEIKDAEEYRQWLEENSCDKAKSPQAIKEAEEKVAGGPGYTLERPKYFPGTKAWLPFDISMSPRAFGYNGRGQSQRGAPFQAGYKALIASERLEMRSKIDKREASLLKMDNLLFVGWSFVQSVLISDLMMAIILHPSLLGVKDSIKDTGGFVKISEATQASTFGPILTPWITAFLIGASIPLRMHMIHLFVYLFTLLFSAPHEVPITVSRYEPLLCPRFSSCTSLRSLWSEGWHQLPRRQYTVIAMRPSARLAKKFNLPASVGRAAGLLFAFFLSGISHELSLEGLLGHIQHIAPKCRQGVSETQLRSMGYGFGAGRYVSTRFFLSQAIIIIFEQIWSDQVEPFLANTILGKGQTRLVEGRLRSVLGWIWCAFWITWPGIAMVDVWSAHGIMCPITESVFFTPLFNLIL
ncbi:uncharacterized protein FA14DRAFT_189068 [Meira miltonrushii]|uniref:Wax synthase domain-containing protein n=1 Tax=Meira miltonrushii TaxID=1280837 RepID=A0A316VD91_9BASI|nr:uncharacterized protein FA14DRAFT_189068 [Meira miltonrushii]PWN35058.1 hypothetical protein FA14DRAFT_189068 [Meira miltonrushii]